ncbi:hypothetical protein FHS34_002042 [Streptomyces echinatus]|uniref:Uncharacterized protein n=1 Tax=Streptomyces echinatus TaxID=67293 RepID=A0A7W9PRQ9_9ACTN|nr:hypothetical protein [Streptomyces echinatus]
MTDLGPLERNVIDLTSQSVEQTTLEVAEGLRTGRFG